MTSTARWTSRNACAGPCAGTVAASLARPSGLAADDSASRGSEPSGSSATNLSTALGIAVGLLDVLVVHLDAIKTQNQSSGGFDLALGIPLLAAGVLLAAHHLQLHRRQPDAQPQKPPQSKLEDWTLRALHEPRFGLAVLIGAAVGAPGASYLVALHHLVASKTPAAIAVVAVLVFVTINWVPVFVPFALLIGRPQGTEKAIKRFTDWITSHERQIAATVALVAGAYMVISGTVRLVS
jgi:Sap, sulfolipid-1-addressing protein